ncbi:epoxide hydrolase [Planomonospora sp. ID91781]|uniref:epoxide hydrolase family protein n=1 Tax=Planomonospora sp. ID91781 TaxID=2738135 RepID=UPI0018C379ED|nr:epoxide hydrolase family protein [Planomonospora sp. ID91781]MBG0825154.1 epoxide hydrolase [Planomonospora sp. ID91781]
MAEDIRPFRIAIPEAAVNDLRDRLARTRWTDEPPPAEPADRPASGPVRPDRWYGVPSAYVRDLAERWRDSFDWRAQEARLNSYPQFTTVIDGQTVHFVHVRSADPAATPLILTHGWPSTFVEYLALVEPLSRDFHLVIPSIPGSGFSGRTRGKGWDAVRVARAWAELMRRLGYDRYGAHGNDAGSVISPVLGRIDPEHVIAVHVNQIFPSGDPAESQGPPPEDTGYQDLPHSFAGPAVHDRARRERPRVLRRGPAGSPAGQLAWICRSLAGVGPDAVLTNASIYWFTGTAASAARFHHESGRASAYPNPTTFPIGLASFAHDFRPVRRLAERDHRYIVSWHEFDRGGRWAAHDAPDLLGEDIRRFFTCLSGR